MEGTTGANGSGPGRFAQFRSAMGRPADAPPPSNMRRTMHASGWMYSSRALVFGWALLLTHQFGISDYGVYAIAFAAGAVLGVPLDSYFTVRAPRVSQDVFDGERTTRVLIGLGLVFLGWMVWPFTTAFLGGFAIGKAGVDVCFQASRSHLIRDGHPDRAQRADAGRQVVGIVLGAAYVLFFPGATIQVAALVYLAGTASPILLGVRNLVVHPPVRPEMTGRTASILGESIGGVAYVQAEVILLGILASTTSAGYYSFGSTIVWSLAALGQSFAYTFHEGLRHSRGNVQSGPPLRTALRLSAATGIVVGVIAVALRLVDLDQAVWLTFAWLAPVSFLRTLSSVSTVVLMMQHRDIFRLKVTAVGLVVKIALIVLLSSHGGPGAAVAFLVSDALVSGAYTISVYGRRGRARVDGDG
jgi:O-antigen/teichoic acid export membrane protein